MLRVGRDVDVSPDVHAGSGAFLERDDREPVEEVIEHLFSLGCGLLRRCRPRIWVEAERTLPLLPIWASPPQTAYRRCRRERLQVAVVNLGGEAGRADRIESDVLVQLQREAVRADRTMEGNEHLSLLGVADALDCPDQPCTLAA